MGGARRRDEEDEPDAPQLDGFQVMATLAGEIFTLSNFDAVTGLPVPGVKKNRWPS